MAITGTKKFLSAVLASADVNQYLMRGVKVFADAATRTAAYGGAGQPTLEEGEVTYLADSNSLWFYDGAAWANVLGSYATVASGTSIAASGPGTYLLTGTTAVSTMSGGVTGMVVTLRASGQAAGVCVVLNNGTGANNLSLRDGANLGLYAGEAVSLVYDGTKWIEVGRDLKALLTHVEITANVTITATTEGTANVGITAGTVTYDGATPVRVEVYAGRLAKGTSWISDCLHDGSASIGYFMAATAASVDRVPYYAVRRFTPPAGSRAYSWRLWVDAGSGAVVAGAGSVGAQAPAFIRVVRDI